MTRQYYTDEYTERDRNLGDSHARSARSLQDFGTDRYF